jgi:hypothetical protein
MFHPYSLDLINQTRRERERHAEQQRVARALHRCHTGDRRQREANRSWRSGER